MKKYIVYLCTILFCMVAVSTMPSQQVYADVIVDFEDDSKSNSESEQFMEEHKEDLTKYRGEFEKDLEEKTIYIWSYPFSGNILDKTVSSIGELSFEYLYLDPEGNELLWGNVKDENFNGWVCISEPDNRWLPSAANQENPTDTEPSTYKKDAEQQEAVVVIVILVVALIISTGVLIAKFWKKKA